MEKQDAVELVGEALNQVRQVIVGQEHMVERLMIALLAKGHLLLEGVPGTAKTLAVRTFATVVGGRFARVQFTPDLVPSDIVGTRIYKASEEGFEVELGPIFVNFVLADEINRAPAKVQSAMLEVMAEKQVSIGGVTHAAPNPFIVIATQNPVESEGVYPLPEAQRDRFLMKVDVPYPDGKEEYEILRRMSVSAPIPQAVLNNELILQLQEQASEVFVHNLVAEYVVRLVLATRNPGDFGMADLEQVISIGCSSRATLGLVAAARALALINGRDYVLPTDVQAVARDVMSHRLQLGFDAVADNIDPAQVIDRIVAMVPAPTPIWNDANPAPANPAPPHDQASAPPAPHDQTSAPPAAPESASAPSSSQPAAAGQESAAPPPGPGSPPARPGQPPVGGPPAQQFPPPGSPGASEFGR